MMKMDDINQKENQVKMSMQAMEMRIANLEDLGMCLLLAISTNCTSPNLYQIMCGFVKRCFAVVNACVHA